MTLTQKKDKCRNVQYEKKNTAAEKVCGRVSSQIQNMSWLWASEYGEQLMAKKTQNTTWMLTEDTRNEASQSTSNHVGVKLRWNCFSGRLNAEGNEEVKLRFDLKHAPNQV